MRGFVVALTRNPISLVGAAVTTASAILFFTMFGIQLFGSHGSPYLGLLSFCIIPAIFVAGLMLIPTGIWLERGRARRAAERGEPPPSFPIIDLNRVKTRKLFLVFLVLTCVNVVILSLATYKGVEVMDSTTFCGATCHSVMDPEYTAYQRSPHSRVPCVSCHIGPGAGWFVKSKLSGSWQLIAVTFNLYPRPIPTPVRNLRPARETCEQCHWPNKFVGDRLKVISRYSEDEANSEKKTVLVVRVGGRQGVASHGIHWHVDPGVRIRYRSDPSRETISDIELTRADGTRELFASAEEAKGKADGQAPEAANAKAGANPDVPQLAQTSNDESWRTMDCVDCHNRPTHIYLMPEDELDRTIEQGRIDRSLPFIRREALKALQGTYKTHVEAREKIPGLIKTFYAGAYPGLVSEKAAQIDAAGHELAQIYCTNVFPEMNIVWGTYPSHIGHQNSPGCFRCHDEMHKTAAGKSISQDCTLCHSLLANEEENPEILKQLQP